MVKIIFDTKTDKDIENIETKFVKRIFKKIEYLSLDPFSKNLDIKKLKNTEYFRLRVGDYRILYKIPNNEEIRIFAIKHRKDAYKNI